MKNLLSITLATAISFGGATAIQQSNQYDLEKEIQRLHAIVSDNRADIHLGYALSAENQYNTWLMTGRLWETLNNSKLFDKEQTLKIRENRVETKELQITQYERTESSKGSFKLLNQTALERIIQYKLDHNQEVWTLKEEEEEEI